MPAVNFWRLSRPCFLLTSSPQISEEQKHSQKPKHNTMTTLLKCISAATLLSGVATADSADNVSSRLQVHVRDNFRFVFGEIARWRKGGGRFIVSKRGSCLFYM